MRAKPPEVDEAELRKVIQREWLFEAASLSYRAVGGGSHHWVATDANGMRRFVTVDDLDTKPWLGADRDSTFVGLKNAFEIALALRNSGLEFVVAPMPAVSDQVAMRLSARYTVALHRYVDGRAGNFDEVPVGAERQAALQMWARLHAATALVRNRAGVRGFGLPGRQDLEAAMGQTDRHWPGGPHSSAARRWLSANRSWLKRALDRFDIVTGQVARSGGDLVITHGEPHGANVMTSASGRFLIDWDTIALALPERDLWMLDDGTYGALQPYVDATGRRVDKGAVALYGMAWHLTDIALFVRQLRSSHADDADSRKALSGLGVAAYRLAAYMPR